MRNAAVLMLAMLCVGCRAQTAPLPAATVAELEKEFGPAALKARETHASIDVMAAGVKGARVYAFLPAEPAAKGPMPFVFFHHGWQGMNPKHYGALIDHLVREGNVVVFPVYQETDDTSPQIVAQAAADAEKNILAMLAARGVTVDAQRVVYFGYSMGAAISLVLAAHPVDGLPRPQALVLAAPGDAYHVAKGAAAKSILPSMRELPETLPVAMVTGEEDTAIGVPTARKLAAQMCTTRADRRVSLLLPADEHGEVKVHAGHGAPGSPDSRYDIELATPLTDVPKHIAGRAEFEASASLNQLDFYGFWKVLDAVIDSLAKAPSTSARYVPPAAVFQSGAAQTFMGTWPDGTAYKAAKVEPVCAR